MAYKTETTCQGCPKGSAATAFAESSSKVVEAMRLPMTKEPSMLDARSGKYAAKLCLVKPA